LFPPGENNDADVGAGPGAARYRGLSAIAPREPPTPLGAIVTTS
jgi:hypothetical protein